MTSVQEPVNFFFVSHLLFFYGLLCWLLCFLCFTSLVSILQRGWAQSILALWSAATALPYSHAAKSLKKSLSQKAKNRWDKTSLLWEDSSNINCSLDWSTNSTLPEQWVRHFLLLSLLMWLCDTVKPLCVAWWWTVWLRDAVGKSNPQKWPLLANESSVAQRLEHPI